MSTFETTLLGREDVASGTTAFCFAKPTGFTFRAGQAIDLILGEVANSDVASVRHTFSIVSAPFEDELIVATRMRDSAFKRTLKALDIGARVKIEGPFGSLTLHNNQARAAVFIAGGIGITPFMSILRQAAHDNSLHQLVLLYSNRRPEDSAFLGELQELAQQRKQFRLIATMTEMDKSTVPWTGETCLIDAQLIEQISRALVSPIYYLVGPPAMVAAVSNAVRNAGVNDDDIRSEEFYGY